MKVRRKEIVFLLVFFFIFIIGYGAPIVKAPIFYKLFNETSSTANHNRRLHDYLSLIPTFGDSKKLG